MILHTHWNKVAQAAKKESKVEKIEEVKEEEEILPLPKKSYKKPYVSLVLDDKIMDEE